MSSPPSSVRRRTRLRRPRRRSNIIVNSSSSASPPSSSSSSVSPIHAHLDTSEEESTFFARAKAALPPEPDGEQPTPLGVSVFTLPTPRISSAASCPATLSACPSASETLLSSEKPSYVLEEASLTAAMYAQHDEIDDMAAFEATPHVWDRLRTLTARDEDLTEADFLNDDQNAHLPSTVGTPQYATDFVYVPITLERLMVVGQAVCLDAFLFILTALPIRFLIAFCTFIGSRLSSRYRLNRVQRLDLMYGLLLISGGFFVNMISVQFIVSFVRKGLFKLKMVNVLAELMDRLLSSFGTNIMGAFVWRFYRVDSASAFLRLLPFWMMSVGYLVLHAFFLFLHVSLIEIQAQSQSHALVSMLILVQFAEVKSGVLKSVFGVKLASVIANDILERFHLLVFLSVIFFYHCNISWSVEFSEWLPPLVQSCCVIYLSEVLVDWIKHTSISNYMGLSPHFYTSVSSKYCRDVKRTFKHSSSFLVHSTAALTKEWGLLPFALALVTLKAFFFYLPLSLGGGAIVLLGWCVLSALRWLLRRFLLWLAARHKIFRHIRKVPELKQSSTTAHTLLLLKPAQYHHRVEVYRTRKRLEHLRARTVERERDTLDPRADYERYYE